MEHFYESVDGWFNFREIYDAAIKEAQDGATFIEIGTWYGRSAAYMAVEIANSGKQIAFYCVDTWKGSVDSPWMAEHLSTRGGSAFPFFRDTMVKHGAWHLVRPLEEDSCVAAEHFPEASVDFVMIDGSHDFRSVRRDIQAWLPKLKTGGLMAGDDALWPEVLIAVFDVIPSTEVQLLNHGANWCFRKRRPVRGHWSFRQLGAESLNYFAYIPYVNRPDFLERAVLSVRDLWPRLVVIDQSAHGIAQDVSAWVEHIAGVFRAPFGSMSFTQMMNWAQDEAFEAKADYLIFMHNDSECMDRVAIETLDYARAHARAGVVFTNYDSFLVFNMDAVRDVGRWDETFEWYFADNDYYHRIRLRGWECLNFGGGRVIHHTSQTLRSDANIKREVDNRWNWHEEHYRHKWGGPPGEERHLIPYDGKP